MAKLIPSLSSCLSKMTPGEKRFARRLEALLEDDYLMWFDIPLGKARRYSDFIILHPRRGILFLEVKDWQGKTLKGLDQKTATIMTDSGRKTVANPVEQARQCAYAAIDRLARDPKLQQTAGKYQGKLCMPYGYGVVLACLSRGQIKRGIPAELQERALPEHLTITQDEFTEKTDPEQFQSQLWGMFDYQFGSALSLPQQDRIRWLLFPELRIEQLTLDLSPEDDAQETPETIPEIVRLMDVQQERLARSLGEGHRVIHGVAGSGKTMILGFRCLYLAEIFKKPVLVLCFNITLAVKLRSFIAAKGINDQVQVYHFHDWCGEQLRTYNITLLESDDPTWVRQVNTVIQAVEKEEIPAAQYGAVLIDEGHDFEAEWLQLVVKMIDPATNSLLLLYDDAQTIYKRREFSLASVGIKAQGRTTILRLNYRNTHEILEFAYAFAKDYMGDSKSEDIPLVVPEAGGVSGAKPVVKKFTTLTEEIDYAARCLKKWHGRGQNWSSMAILYPAMPKQAGKQASAALRKAAIPYQWLRNANDRKNYQPDTEKVPVMSIASSKGLEFDTVVIVNASYERSNTDTDEMVQILYVGFTRACKNLLVSYHTENAISGLLSPFITETR